MQITRTVLRVQSVFTFRRSDNWAAATSCQRATAAAALSDADTLSGLDFTLAVHSLVTVGGGENQTTILKPLFDYI